MFRLLPITPKWLMDFLLDSKIYKAFRFIPLQVAVIIAVDVFVSYMRKDYYAKWIMGWYIKQIYRHITGRVVTISD